MEKQESRIYHRKDTKFTSVYDPEFGVFYFNKSDANLDDCSWAKKILHRAYTKVYFAMKQFWPTSRVKARS